MHLLSDPLLIVQIERDTPAGAALVRLRHGEVGIGHDCELMAMLSHDPLVVEASQVCDLLSSYFRGGDLSVDGGGAHGLSWRRVGTDVAEAVSSLPWLSQDLRSIWIAHWIQTGLLPAISSDEPALAAAWLAYARRVDPVWEAAEEVPLAVAETRPVPPLRESALRKQIRLIQEDLDDELEALRTGRLKHRRWKSAWYRLGETWTLLDGSILRLEHVGSDGGIYVGWFQLSRYRPGSLGRMLPEEALLERVALRC